MANPTVAYVRSGASDAQEEFKSGVVANGGAITEAADIDFSKCGVFRCTMTNVSVALTPKNLPIGRPVRIHIHTGTTAPTVTWGTVSPTLAWTTTPAYAAGKVTQITLVNDGLRVVGSHLKEA